MGFINGEVKLSMHEIDNMTVPELSILKYAMEKKAKRDSKFYSSMLGGGM